ncbi:hypothetical protein HYV69_03385 [Candidatus Uhrbacteria bacterium]|nr:hypothetical protein [Candidatus Uhrbacteria bacterium]
MTLSLKATEYCPRSPEERIEGICVLLPLQERSGWVFLIARCHKQTADAEMLFQLLSDQIHRLADSFGSEANAQHRFEQFLGALNETLAQNVRDGRWSVPIEQFDAVLGIACDKQMFLSGTGDLTALFLHRKPSQRYQVFNLFHSIQSEQSLPTWEKAFAVVLDGDLHEGDVFSISNIDLQRALAVDELNAILTTLPPSGATEKIRQYFPLKTALLLIVLKVQDVSAQNKNEQQATLKTDVSIQHFKSQEEETRELLADQTPKLKTLLTVIKIRTKKFAEKEIWKFIWRWVRRSAKKSVKTSRHLMTKEGRLELQTNFQRIVRSFTHMDRSKKYLLGGIAAVVVVLIVSISLFSSSRARSRDEQAYQQKIDVITDQMERATGAVIYKDENQARSLFVNAANLIDQLPSNTEERVQKINDLKIEIQKSMDDIRHLVNVPNPALLGDLSSVTDGIFGQSFVKVGSDVYVFATDGRVYQLDRTQKVFKPASVQEINARVSLSASVDKDKVFSLNENNIVSQFIKDESVQKPISLEQIEGKWIDLLAYANRLYVLTQTEADGQVYRYGRSGDGFGAPAKWITSKTSSLKDARSFTIDGTVFVLMKNGKITRFVSGSEVGWETGIVDPPITNATDIWTDTDSAYLYVLEPDTKRLVVFNKDTGAFVVQYSSDAFQNLTDVIVDEPGYTIYLLSGSKLYSIAPSHIAR